MLCLKQEAMPGEKGISLDLRAGVHPLTNLTISYMILNKQNSKKIIMIIIIILWLILTLISECPKEDLKWIDTFIKYLNYSSYTLLMKV